LPSFFSLLFRCVDAESGFLVYVEYILSCASPRKPEQRSARERMPMPVRYVRASRCGVEVVDVVETYLGLVLVWEAE